jgi:hypothetical protein
MLQGLHARDAAFGAPVLGFSWLTGENKQALLNCCRNKGRGTHIGRLNSGDAIMTFIKTASVLFVVLVSTLSTVRAEDPTTKPGVTGTVESVDHGARTVILDGGRIYRMREDADMSTISHGVSIALACATDGMNCMVITAGPANDMVPESQTNPSAGN